MVSPPLEVQGFVAFRFRIVGRGWWLESTLQWGLSLTFGPPYMGGSFPYLSWRRRGWRVLLQIRLVEGGKSLQLC